MSALTDILRNGGGYWPRPANGPGRALAIPNGARFRIALPADDGRERPSGGPSDRARWRGRRGAAKAEPPESPPVAFVGGACRNGLFVLDEDAGAKSARTFDTIAAAAEAAGARGDLFTAVAFLVGERWMSADALRGSDAMPWNEADELALDIAAAAIRDKLKEDGETLSPAQVMRKAADAVAGFPYFLDEARERLAWK